MAFYKKMDIFKRFFRIESFDIKIFYKSLYIYIQIFVIFKKNLFYL